MILGADWLLPVDGPPIREGTVESLATDHRRPRRGRAVRPDLSGSVILPGLVNAHSHLEYARMSGFGDGKPFTPWIEEHIRRKAALDHPADSLVQAVEGAQVLPGRRRHHCRRLQLCGHDRPGRHRRRPARDRLPGGVQRLAAAGPAHVRRPGRHARVAAGGRGALAARAVHRHPGGLRTDDRDRPRARAAGGDACAGVAARAPAPQPPGGPAGRRHGAHPRRVHDRRRHRAGGTAGCAGGALPALERAPGLRGGAGWGDAGRRSACGAGHRLAGLGHGLRPVGGDALRDHAGPRPGGQGRRDDRGRRA